jgi:hypothetical protein
LVSDPSAILDLAWMLHARLDPQPRGKTRPFQPLLQCSVKAASLGNGL